MAAHRDNNKSDRFAHTKPSSSTCTSNSNVKGKSPQDKLPVSVKVLNSVEEAIQEALNDQGDHEVEVVTSSHESSLGWERCQKNPGHANFITAPEFGLNHLPEPHRKEDVLTLIQRWSELTVNVCTAFTSNERPQDYPFYNVRGKSLTRTGSGKVSDVSTVEEDPCPCPECADSDSPKKVWGAVWVMTAMHVVFDDIEAKKTTVQLFFDDEDQSTVRTLHGLRVVDSNIAGDWCKFECASHDMELIERLDAALTPLMTLADNLKEEYGEGSFPSLVVVVSHPHGCAKQISIGETKSKKLVEHKGDFDYRWTQYEYTAATCRGSSGAPVWILEPDRTHFYAYYDHVHSGSPSPTEGINKCGAGDVIKIWE